MVRHNFISRKKDWAFIKGETDLGAGLDYEEKKESFRVFITKGNTMFFINLFSPNHRTVTGQSPTNAADYSDFVTNYKTTIDTTPPFHSSPVVMPEVGITGQKLQIHESSRPDNPEKKYTTVWTGAGDDIAGGILGGGTPLRITTTAGTLDSSVDIEFDPLWGEVWVHEGYFQWTGAGTGDYITASVYAKPTPLQTSTDLDYEKDGTRIKLATGGPGTGTHGFAGNPVLVPNDAGTGYWDYTTTLVPNLTTTGKIDLFDKEIEVSRFINMLPMFGSSSSYIRLQSADSSRLLPDYILRVNAHNASDTIWDVWCIITIYREMDIVPPIQQ